MLQLDRVTLCCVDTTNHALALRALDSLGAEVAGLWA